MSGSGLGCQEELGADLLGPTAVNVYKLFPTSGPQRGLRRNMGAASDWPSVGNCQGHVCFKS